MGYLAIFLLFLSWTDFLSQRLLTFGYHFPSLSCVFLCAYSFLVHLFGGKVSSPAFCCRLGGWTGWNYGWDTGGWLGFGQALHHGVFVVLTWGFFVWLIGFSLVLGEGLRFKSTRMSDQTGWGKCFLVVFFGGTIKTSRQAAFMTNDRQTSREAAIYLT